VIRRTLRFFDRLLESVNQLGVANSLRVFSYLLPGSDHEVSIKKGRHTFYFHPVSDKGVLSHFYKPGYRIGGNPGLIFDVGANIGDETFRFRHFHPTAKIIALEPALRNFLLLQKNCISDSNIKAIHGALWWESCQLNLAPSDSQSHESYSLVHPEQRSSHHNHSETVRAFTVNEILTEHNLTESDIDIFKIDVEGAEEFIFCNGNRDWLLRVNVIIMEMPDSDAPGSFQSIIDTLSELGIRGSAYICGENFVFCKQGSGFTLEHVIGFGH
jgi:FkbM family methyltransferase